MGRGWMATDVGPQDMRTWDCGPQGGKSQSREGPRSAPGVGEVKEKSWKVEKGPREGRHPRKFLSLLAEMTPGVEVKCRYSPYAPREAGGSPKSSSPPGLGHWDREKGMVFTCPSADQAREVHWGGSALLLVLITSCFSSSTMILPSRSCRRTEEREGMRGPARRLPRPNPTQLRNAIEGTEDRSETASGFPHRNALRWHRSVSSRRGGSALRPP